MLSVSKIDEEFSNLPLIPSPRESIDENITVIPPEQTLSGLKKSQSFSKTTSAQFQPPCELKKSYDLKKSPYELRKIPCETRKTQCEMRKTPCELKKHTIIEKMKSPTHTPKALYHVRASNASEYRTDEIMDKILEKGYLVNVRLYINGEICYLIAKTQKHDMFFILIDNESWKKTFPHAYTENHTDIELNKKENSILLPQDTIVANLNCLDNPHQNVNVPSNFACGTAFICDGNLCIAKKSLISEPSKVHFHTENYVFPCNTINAGHFDGLVRSYPIIPLSVLLSSCNLANEIEKLNIDLKAIAFQKLKQKSHDLNCLVTELQKTQANIDILINKICEIETDICKLTYIYTNTLPQYECLKPQILNELIAKKQLSDNIIESVGNSLSKNKFETLRTINCDLNNSLKNFGGTNCHKSW